MDFKLQVLSSAPRAMSRDIRRGLQGRASNLKLIALRSRALCVFFSPMGSRGAVFKGRGVPFEAPSLSRTPSLALLLAASQQVCSNRPHHSAETLCRVIRRNVKKTRIFGKKCKQLSWQSTSCTGTIAWTMKLRPGNADGNGFVTACVRHSLTGLAIARIRSGLSCDDADSPFSTGCVVCNRERGERPWFVRSSCD